MNNDTTGLKGPYNDVPDMIANGLNLAFSASLGILSMKRYLPNHLSARLFLRSSSTIGVSATYLDLKNKIVSYNNMIYDSARKVHKIYPHLANVSNETILLHNNHEYGQLFFCKKDNICSFQFEQNIKKTDISDKPLKRFWIKHFTTHTIEDCTIILNSKKLLYSKARSSLSNVIENVARYGINERLTIVNGEQSVNGRILLGGDYIVLDDTLEESVVIRKVRDDFLKEAREKQIKDTDIAKLAYKFSINCFTSSEDDDTSKKITLLDENIVRRTGVCRHHMMLTGYLLEIAKKENLIEGTFNTKLGFYENAEEGHAWVEYITTDGEKWILDGINKLCLPIKDIKKDSHTKLMKKYYTQF